MRPKLTAHEYPIIPIKRVYSLKQSNALNHPNYHSLECRHPYTTIVQLKLVNDEDNGEYAPQNPNPIIESGHDIDIVDVISGPIDDACIVFHIDGSESF